MHPAFYYSVVILVAFVVVNVEILNQLIKVTICREQECIL